MCLKKWCMNEIIPLEYSGSTVIDFYSLVPKRKGAGFRTQNTYIQTIFIKNNKQIKQLASSLIRSFPTDNKYCITLESYFKTKLRVFS